MKTTLTIITFLFWLFPLYFGIKLITEHRRHHRRHKRLMRLFDQADVIDRQFKKAIQRADVYAAEFHFERHKEISELIESEMKNRKR